jgi:hypothetical protein
MLRQLHLSATATVAQAGLAGGCGWVLWNHQISTAATAATSPPRTTWVAAAVVTSVKLKSQGEAMRLSPAARSTHSCHSARCDRAAAEMTAMTIPPVPAVQLALLTLANPSNQGHSSRSRPRIAVK